MEDGQFHGKYQSHEIVNLVGPYAYTNKLYWHSQVEPGLYRFNSLHAFIFTCTTLC